MHVGSWKAWKATLGRHNRSSVRSIAGLPNLIGSWFAGKFTFRFLSPMGAVVPGWKNTTEMAANVVQRLDHETNKWGTSKSQSWGRLEGFLMCLKCQLSIEVTSCKCVWWSLSASIIHSLLGDVGTCWDSPAIGSGQSLFKQGPKKRRPLTRNA